MKYPKLKQRVLCQLTVGLPIILLILIPLLLVLLAGVTVWVFIGGLVLACVYLFCNISTLFFLDIALSTVHSMENERLEYRTEQNGTTRDEIAHAILSRCRSWGTQLPGQSDDNLLFYLHKPSFIKFYSGYQYRVVVRSVPQVDPDSYRLYRTQATQLMRQAPVGTSAWWQTRQEKEQPVCKADVLILLADTVAPSCKSLPYQDQALRVCLVECATGKYYMNSELESYEQGVMPKPAQNYQVELLHKLVFDDHLPLESNPDAPPASGMFSPEDSLWTFLARTRRDFKDIDEESEREEEEMLKTLPENQVQMGECAIYYKYHSRLYICNCVPDDDDPKLLLSVFPDLGSVGFNKDHSKLTRRDCSDAEKSRLMSAVRSWATANGWRIEDCDDDEA